MASTIAKNTFYLTAASVFQKIFSFIYFSLLARFLGVADIGLYATVLSFTSVFLIFVDMGFTPVLIREGAKDKEHIKDTMGQVILAKLIFAVVTYLFLSITVFFIRGHYANPLQFQQLIAIMGLMMVLNSFSTTFYGALRSYQKLSYEAYGVMISQIIIVISGLLFLWLKPTVSLLFIALGMGDLFSIIYAGYILRKKYNIKPHFKWNTKLFKTILVFGIPFALAGIFTRVYSVGDHIIISYLVGTKEVGFYSIPSKIAFAFQFIPLAFAATLYPAMSVYFANDKPRLKLVFEKGIFYLAMLALPLSFGIAAIADVFITKVYGAAYLPSVVPLQILVASLIFAFLDFPVGSLLNACNMQRIQTTAMGVTMVFNILLNIILIPRFSIIGAAVAALLSNAALFIFGYIYVHRIVELPSWKFWGKIAKILLAAAIMGLVVILFKGFLIHIFAPAGFIRTLTFLGILMLLGGITYLLLLFIFGILRKEEINDLLALVKRS